MLKKYLFVVLFVASWAGVQLPAIAFRVTESPCQQNSNFINDSELESALEGFFIDELGFTLIGAKPATIREGRTDYLDSHPEATSGLLRFLTETFQNSTRFILKASATNNKSCFIEFINKVALRKVIRENPELQAFVKKRFVDTEGFFAYLQHSEESLYRTFKGNDFLLGLVLGYGRTNSEYYCRKCDVGMYLKKSPFFEIFQNNLHPHILGGVLVFFLLDDFSENSKEIPSVKNFNSLEEEWQWIQDISWDLRNSCESAPPHYLPLPFYICRHGGDSEAVRDKYLKARALLANLFYNRSFKEALLEEASKK